MAESHPGGAEALVGALRVRGPIKGAPDMRFRVKPTARRHPSGTVTDNRNTSILHSTLRAMALAALR